MSSRAIAGGKGTVKYQKTYKKKGLRNKRKTALAKLNQEQLRAQRAKKRRAEELSGKEERRDRRPRRPRRDRAAPIDWDRL